uniref:Uncharacterized protein n=1 Tax=Macaca fascicularis TaxID=9541 RepID=A0A7N9D0U0_MACFA
VCLLQRNGSRIHVQDLQVYYSFTCVMVVCCTDHPITNKSAPDNSSFKTI